MGEEEIIKDLLEKEAVLNQYINQLLKEEILPFFKDTFPDMYNPNLKIDVKMRDNIPIDEAKIYSPKGSGEIRYDIIGKVNDLDKVKNSKDIGEQVSSFSSVIEDLPEEFVARRKVVDSIFLVHECMHQMMDRGLRGDNKSQQSYERNLQKVLDISKNKSDKQLIDGIDNRKVLVDMKKVMQNYGEIGIGEMVAKNAELVFIDKMTKEGFIKPEEKDNIMKFQNTFCKDLDSFKAMNRLYNKVGEKQFANYIKNYDAYKCICIQRKDLQTGEPTEEYKEFLDSPEEFMKQIATKEKTEDKVSNIEDDKDIDKKDQSKLLILLSNDKFKDAIDTNYYENQRLKNTYKNMKVTKEDISKMTEMVRENLNIKDKSNDKIQYQSMER